MFSQQKEQLQGTFCPLIRKDCIKEKCSWWVQVMGKHPQTGEQLNHFGCAVAWMPILQIETTQMVRGAQAATESFRNLIAEGMVATQQIEEGERRRN